MQSAFLRVNPARVLRSLGVGRTGPRNPDEGDFAPVMPLSTGVDVDISPHESDEYRHLERVDKSLANEINLLLLERGKAQRHAAQIITGKTLESNDRPFLSSVHLLFCGRSA